MFQLVAMMVGVDSAVFLAASGTFGLCRAGGFTAEAVFCLHGVAGAAAAVGIGIVHMGPLAPSMGVLIAILPVKHRQCLTHRRQILTLAVPRVFTVVTAMDQQRQHRAVGELCGGLGAGGFIYGAIFHIVFRDGIFSCGIQIVAIFYCFTVAANNFADERACHGASVIAVVDLGSRVPSYNTTDIDFSLRFHRAYIEAVVYRLAFAILARIAHNAAYIRKERGFAGAVHRHNTGIVAADYGAGIGSTHDTAGFIQAEVAVSAYLHLAGVAAIPNCYTCGQSTHDAAGFTGITTVRFNHSGIDAAHNDGIRGPTHNTGGTR